MIPAQRRQKMLEFISSNSAATIKELSDRFQVSEMTIHRDLNHLEAIGRIRKTYGGVVISDSVIETDFDRRMQRNRSSKEAIGLAAANLIDSGDSVLLDASSTVFTMLPGIYGKTNLIVITTSVMILARLSGRTGVELYATGGMVYGDTTSLIGPSAIHFLENIHVDKCFLGATGVTAKEGTTDPLSLIVELKRAMARAANEVILLVDYSKFGMLSRFKLLALDEIDLIVTDEDKNSPHIDEISRLGIEFLFCNPVNHQKGES